MSAYEFKRVEHEIEVQYLKKKYYKEQKIKENKGQFFQCLLKEVRF